MNKRLSSALAKVAIGARTPAEAREKILLHSVGEAEKARLGKPGRSAMLHTEMYMFGLRATPDALGQVISAGTRISNGAQTCHA